MPTAPTTTLNSTAQTEDPYDRTVRVAGHLAAFKTINAIPLPLLTALVQEMDLLRHTSRLSAPGTQKDGMCVPLRSGVGKSTAARMLVRRAAERAGTSADKGPVLYVELDVEETVSLWNAILRALGDPYWTSGNPKNIKARAIKYMAKRGVEIIIIDEFNHSMDRGQARFLMNTVKEILNAGIAPVVVMGTDEEIERLPTMPAFERRMVHAPEIGPISWENSEHKKNWCGFLQGLDEGIVELKILDATANLKRKKLAEALCDACDGVLGYAHWVVQDSLTEALKRNGRSIELADLAQSVNRLFVKFQIYGRVNAVEGLS